MTMDWNRFNNEVSSAILDADRLNDLLGELDCDLKVKPAGRVFRGPCPVHGGRDHNFQLTVDGYALPIRWKCYSHHCDEQFKPSLLGLVRGVLTFQKDQSPRPVADAVAFLRKFTKDMPIRPARPSLPKSAPAPVRLSLSRDQVRARLQIPSPFYLARGYSAEVLNAMDIGHSGVRNKTIVPFYDQTGQVCIGFTERSEKPVCRECGRCHHPKDDCKYGQMKWCLPEGFTKVSYLYNYGAVAGSASKFVLLVEGPGDVLRAMEAGVPAVASLGCDLSSEQARLLAGLNRWVHVAFDNDDSGRKGARQAFQTLMAITHQVRPCPIPSRVKDLGEMRPEEVRGWIRPVADSRL